MHTQQGLKSIVKPEVVSQSDASNSVGWNYRNGDRRFEPFDTNIGAEHRQTFCIVISLAEYCI